MWLLILAACSRPPTARDEAYAVRLFNLLSQETLCCATGHHTLAPPSDEDADDAPWQGQADLWLGTADMPDTLEVRLSWNDVLVRRMDPDGWDPYCDDPTMSESCAIDWDPDDFVFSGELTGTLTLAVRDATAAPGLSVRGPDIDVEGVLDGDVPARMTVTRTFRGDGESWGTERLTAVARIDGADVGPFGWELYEG